MKNTHVKDYLEMISGFLAQNGKPAGFHYGSAEDFVLQNGKAYDWAPVPENIPMGTMRECYKNAFHLAIENPELTYCEGYGLNMIPTEHAWCVDKDGNVIDNTWPADEKDPPTYFGVEMPINFVMKRVMKNGYYGVIFGGVRTNIDLMKDPWEDVKNS